MRRKLLLLAAAALGAFAVALADKALNGPDWLAFLFITGGLGLLAAVLWIADGIAREWEIANEVDEFEVEVGVLRRPQLADALSDRKFVSGLPRGATSSAPMFHVGGRS